LILLAFVGGRVTCGDDAHEGPAFFQFVESVDDHQQRTVFGESQRNPTLFVLAVVFIVTADGQENGNRYESNQGDIFEEQEAKQIFECRNEYFWNAMTAKKKTRKIGGVYKIQTDSQCLWLVALRDSSYGVMMNDPSGEHVCRADFFGTYSIFDTFIKTKTWELVGSVRFRHEHDEWPSPTRLHELSDPEGKYVYYRGEIHESSSDVSELNVTQIFKPEQFASFMDRTLANR